MKFENSLVSVIIPTYNRAKELQRALQSLIDQFYTNWEAIIVDNYSEDNTDSIINAFQDDRMHLFKLPHTGIIAASRNFGIKKASGQSIAFLDSDDWWDASKLLISVNALNSGADIVYHNLWRIEVLGAQPNGLIEARSFGNKIIQEFLYKGNLLPNSSVVVNASVLRAAGSISEDRSLVASEDIDLWIKIAHITKKFYKIPGCWGYYWAGGNNISQNRDFSIAAKMILKTYSDRLTKYEMIMAQGYILYVEGTYLLYQKKYKSAVIRFFKSFFLAHYLIKLKSIYRTLSIAKIILK